MSTKPKSKLPVVIQVFAIIVLVLAVLSAVFTLLIRMGASDASENELVPSLFGSEYLPVQSEKFEPLSIENDSLVILKPLDADGVMTNDVVVFSTPLDFSDNAVYQSFSMGRVLEMTSDGTLVQYTIQGLGSNGDVIIDSTAVVGIAGWQIALLGALVSMLLGSGGIIYFIVIPLFAFIVLQLLVVILRMTISSDDEDEAAIAEVENKYDAIKRAAVSKEEPDTYAPQEPLEPMSLNFERKHVSAALQDVKSQTFTTIPPSNSPLVQRTQPIQTQPKKATDATTKSQIDVSELLLSSIQETKKPEENPVFGLLDEQRSPSRSDEFKSVLSMVDDLLNDIKTQQAQIVTSADAAPVVVDQQCTQEFSLHEIRSRLNEQSLLEQPDSFVQHEQSQKLLDNILIELKENALDVQFDNVKSDGVDIEKTAAGDGFTIDTPRYKANVNIKMDRK